MFSKKLEVKAGCPRVARESAKKLGGSEWMCRSGGGGSVWAHAAATTKLTVNHKISALSGQRDRETASARRPDGCRQGRRRREHGD